MSDGEVLVWIVAICIGGPLLAVVLIAIVTAWIDR